MTSSHKNKPPFLGIDWGLKRIGISISPDGENVFTRQHLVVESTQSALNSVGQLIRDEGVNTVVLGLPLTLSGDEGHMTETIRSFGQELQTEHHIHVVYWDERMTTHAAREMQKEGSRASKDSLSALVMLQSYLGL